MANLRRDQEHLGIDTNVLVAYLDQDHPNHDEVQWLAQKKVVLNPTIIHEAYHTLVFKMKWTVGEASEALKEAATDESNLFINQSLKTTKVGLELAAEHDLGGRDALILANLLTGKISKFFTYDRSLLALRKIKYGRTSLEIIRADSVVKRARTTFTRKEKLIMKI